MRTSRLAATAVALLASACIANPAEEDPAESADAGLPPDGPPTPACAAPECPAGAFQRFDAPCPADAEGCLTVTVCDQTIVCETPEVGCAEPACPARLPDTSDRPCDPFEPGCETLSACGVTLVCRTCDPAVACPGATISEGVGCPDVEGGSCRHAEVCGQTYTCDYGVVNCEAIPQCGPGEVESITPCGAGEDCRAVAVCGSTIYCRPEVWSDCQAGEVATMDPCLPFEPDCHRATEPANGFPGGPAAPDEGEAADRAAPEQLYCRPEASVCHVQPVCLAGEVASGADDGAPVPCALDEVSCTPRGGCGRWAYCREDGDCDGLRECGEGEVPSEVPCGHDEPDCRRVGGNRCGDPLFCRAGPECRAIPACDWPAVPSNVPCEPDEPGEHCLRRTECATTIFCRQ